ncbi:Fe-S oxidoreductase [Desulfosporosinus orientis DSM 765]|uniref:Glycolate oxidase iron-sulfur subunit n=1 Tax=Desulfosporosinus orientis (strain ATCC 19365 / DSM 765 / NCIMB 8382 / VKM B-1628 / Singapore I) TaxID=768706 RepID=G7W6H6_DESOD|nr:(Fe-S)-binding protein [Desulfosporosinus orientis]AET68614.1 Fe-S oxidoreductase [Desulfosporosinus orientis DSM 765]
MSVYDSLGSITEELHKCMKCGNCMAVCPIYKETRQEVGVARGKISLAEYILSGETEMTKRMGDRFSLCTTCMACNSNCPCGVRFDKIILAARAEAVRKKGLQPAKKIAFTALKMQRVFDFGMKAGSIFQGVALKNIPNKHSKLARMRVDVGIGKEKVFPMLAKKTLRSEFPEVIRVNNPKMRVGFFTGCMINYFYTDIGRAVIEVLKENDIEVVMPKSQACCGIPASVNGDVTSARTLAKRNLRAFERMGADALVVACSSGGTAWKHVFGELLEDDHELKALADQWAKKSYDISEFLIHQVPFKKEGLGRVERKVTYHEPCHLNRGQGISKEPREILKSIPGMELIEMKEPGRCCGMAGSFSLVHPDLSGQISDRKTADIQTTHTDTVATGCPACRLQLQSGVENAGFDEEVLHTVQILAESYRAGKKE